MNELLKQIRIALDAKLYYLALFAIVTIPDICCALESENNNSNKHKYMNWFNRYVAKLNQEKYGDSKNLTASHLWGIRCSLVHQGITADKTYYKRMLFIEPGHPRFGMHCVAVGAGTDSKSLLIDIEKFANDIISGAEEWMEENSENGNYAENSKKLIQRYANGVAPVFGVPVIG